MLTQNVRKIRRRRMLTITKSFFFTKQQEQCNEGQFILKEDNEGVQMIAIKTQLSYGDVLPISKLKEGFVEVLTCQASVTLKMRVCVYQSLEFIGKDECNKLNEKAQLGEPVSNLQAQDNVLTFSISEKLQIHYKLGCKSISSQTKAVIKSILPTNQIRS